METIVVLQYGLTALSSAFNAGYFARYRSAQLRRRIGARVLAVASLALALESAYFGHYLFSHRMQADAWAWLLAGSLSAVGSWLMTVLILRSAFGVLHHRS